MVILTCRSWPWSLWWHPTPRGTPAWGGFRRTRRSCTLAMRIVCLKVEGNQYKTILMSAITKWFTKMLPYNLRWNINNVWRADHFPLCKNPFSHFPPLGNFPCPSRLPLLGHFWRGFFPSSILFKSKGGVGAKIIWNYIYWHGSCSSQSGCCIEISPEVVYVFKSHVFRNLSQTPGWPPRVPGDAPVP